MSSRTIPFALLLAALAASSRPAAAQSAGTEDGISEYFSHWFDRVQEAQSSQPSWMTPLFTVTPRLEQEVRTDVIVEKAGNGALLDSYGNGKGLELIPTTTNEVILNAPTYIDRYNKRASGFGDWPFLLVKQRLLSANAAHGDYIVTAFLGLQAPVGSRAFTNHAWTVSPTIAAGKGWGDFDIQATSGVAVPLGSETKIGLAVASNVALQYHVLRYFCPEVEFNWTVWSGGLRDGKNQLLVTPGIILGRFVLAGRLKAIFGVGYQEALSPKLTKEPVLTPLYDHGWVTTARLAF